MLAPVFQVLGADFSEFLLVNVAIGLEKYGKRQGLGLIAQGFGQLCACHARHADGKAQGVVMEEALDPWGLVHGQTDYPQVLALVLLPEGVDQGQFFDACLLYTSDAADD